MADIYKQLEKGRTKGHEILEKKSKELKPESSIPILSFEQVCNLCEEMIEAVRNAQLKMQNQQNNPADFAELILLVEKIVDQLLAGNEEIFFTLNLREVEHYLYIHTISVCLLSLELGISSGLAREKLIELGIEAVLFDIEFVNFSELYKNKISKDVHEYKSEIEKALSVSAFFKNVENESGISFLDFLLLTETYITGVYPPQPDKLSTYHDSFKEIIKNKQLFPNKLLKLFVTRIGPYPVGTTVKLNSGEKGWVAGRNLEIPLRPQIKIAVDINGQKIKDGRIIDLMEHPTIYIRNQINAEELYK